MLLIPQPVRQIDVLVQALRRAETPTPELVTDIIEGACPRICSLKKTGAASQIPRLIKSEAWTDLALALVALELPAWTIRRLARDNGIWLCSLSKQSNMPVELDDTADASHQNLPLAIMIALVEARLRSTLRETEVHTVPYVRPSRGHPACCDNFA